MEHQYDEDITQNFFYSCLTRHHAVLFDKATTARWTICVPRAGSLAEVELTEADFENHILQPKDEDLGQYVTINNKEVTIRNCVITTDEGFTQQRKVAVLFEETFFNKKEESYRVLCINQPLEGASDDSIDVHGTPVYSYSNCSVEECANLLWGTTGNPRTRKNLGDLIDAFQKSLTQMSAPNLNKLLTTCKAFFSKAMTIVMRDPYMKRTSRSDHTFLDNVKLAIENHLMYGVHKRLFRMLCGCQAARDARLNKLTRNLSHVQLQHLGVRVEFCQNVPRARKELSSLTLHRTPTGKLSCIKRIVAALTKSRGISQSDPGVPIALTTDDLLPILVFLVLKADICNWWAHFEHMTAFRFSQSNYDDEFGFYLATLEAALDYVSSGELLDLEPNQCLDTPQIRSPNTQEREMTLWHQQDRSTAAVNTLFQYVKDKNKPAVLEILQKSRSRRSRVPTPGVNSTRPLCHPLCICNQCRLIVQSANQTQESSHVTIYSTDAKGYTVLHVAAFYGHIDIADIVINQGALVNATDYLGQTPLHVACKLGHQAMALLLLHNDAMFNERDTDGNTALHLAALYGHDDCAKALVFFDQGEKHLNLDATNDFGDTPLHLASKWGFGHLVSLLLENGASAQIKNRKNHDALRYSHNDDIAECIRAAIEKETQEKKGMFEMRKSQSLYSSFTSQTTTVKGPTPTKPSTLPRSQSQAVLQTASNKASGGNRRLSEASIASSTSIASNSTESRSTERSNSLVVGRSPSVDAGRGNPFKNVDKLLKAVADGDVQMAKFHLGWTSESEEEDEPSEFDESQRKLCHPLCQCQKCQPLQRFTTISAKRDIHVNSEDIHGYTALHVAAHNSHVTLVDLLLRRGANVNQRTSSQGTTPLHMACRQPNIAVLHSLLRRGAEINSADDEGNTPLHYCSMMGNERKARLLIQRSADVNQSNKKGNTPLHDAVRWNFINVVRLLIQSGALVHSRNIDNKLPVHYSQTEQMSKMLRSALIARKPATEKTLPTSDVNSVTESEANKLPIDHAEVTQRLSQDTEVTQRLSQDTEVTQRLSQDTGKLEIASLSSIAEADPTKHKQSDGKQMIGEETLDKNINQSSHSPLSGPTDVADKHLRTDDGNEHLRTDDGTEHLRTNVGIEHLRTDVGAEHLEQNIGTENLRQPGQHGSDAFFDIDLDEEDLTIIENHYGNKHSCHRSGCCHDNSSQCDSCSENSKTESQQDLSI